MNRPDLSVFGQASDAGDSPTPARYTQAGPVGWAVRRVR